jgi:hypothetical protein
MAHCLVLLLCLSPPGAAPAEPAVHPDIHIRLTELLEQKLAKIDEAVRSAEAMLREGKSVEALGPVKEACRKTEEAIRICGFIRTVASGDEKWAASLSVVRIRALAHHPRKRILKNPDALGSRAWVALLAERVVMLDKTRVLDAEVLEVHTVGSRYRPGTLKGRLRPNRKRADLKQGERILLHNDPKKSGIELQVGPEYWAIIEPSNPWDGIPGLIGGSGRTYVAFAVQSP